MASFSGESGAHFYVAETRGRSTVPGTHGLHGLAFAAIGSAPQRPIFFTGDPVAAIPEFCGDAAITGIFEHANFFAAFDFPADLGGKLKLVAAIVDGPGAIGLHPDAIVGACDQFVGRARAGLDADVGHANDGQTIPTFGAHGTGGAIEPDKLGGFTIGKIAAELAVLDNVSTLRGNAFVVVGEGAQAGAVFEAGIGDNIDDFRPIFEIVEFIESEKTGAGEIGFLAEYAIKFDGMSDGFVDLQAELATVEKKRAGFFRALQRGVESYGFFGDAGGVL